MRGRGALLAGLLCLLALQPLAARAASPTDVAQAQSPCTASASHVAVVVENQDTEIFAGCVAITGTSEVALSILQSIRSMPAPGIDDDPGLGDELCQVDGVPSHYNGSGCLTSDEPYWGLFLTSGPSSEWQFAPAGIDSFSVTSGGALGLNFANDPEKPPPPDGICPTALSPTPTPLPTARPTTPSPQSTPTAAHRPGSTATPRVHTSASSVAGGPVPSASTTAAAPNPTGQPGLASNNPTGIEPPPPAPPPSVAELALLAVVLVMLGCGAGVQVLRRRQH